MLLGHFHHLTFTFLSDGQTVFKRRLMCWNIQLINPIYLKGKLIMYILCHGN